MRREWHDLVLNLLADLNRRECGWAITLDSPEDARVVFSSPDGVPIELNLADVEAYAFAHILRKLEVAREQKGVTRSRVTRGRQA